jgi:hypothetical protein
MIVFIATAAGCHGWKANHSYACTHFCFLKMLITELVTIPSVDALAMSIAAIDHTQLARLLEAEAIVFLGVIQKARLVEKKYRPPRRHLSGRYDRQRGCQSWKD